MHAHQHRRVEQRQPQRQRELPRRPLRRVHGRAGYVHWQKTAEILNKKDFDMEVLKLLEKTEYKDGWDLVDVIQYEDIK